jgi:polysaccharide export outer membrane protein
MTEVRFAPRWLRWAALALSIASAGCRLTARPGELGPPLNGPPGQFPVPPTCEQPWGQGVPTEKDKSTLPDYVIEPPDILLIEVLKVLPKPPYHLAPLDILQVVVSGTLPDQPIAGQVAVDPNGTIDLGPAYGKVRVQGLTIEAVTQAIEEYLKDTLASPEASVSLVEAYGLQPITGEHLVAPDGTVNLGTYGSVNVAGMTVAQASAAVDAHLGQFLDDPHSSLSVFAYNSHVYYVITEGAGQGDSVLRMPITGNETVLDAISQINGIGPLSSKRLWIARPGPHGACDQLLPVNWTEITKNASTATNYQVLPGDRVFIAQNNWIALDTALNRMIAPFERIFGFSLLGTQTIQTMNRFPLGFQGGTGF